MAERFHFFATCAPGIEPVLHAEARELGLSGVERQVGGVAFRGTMRDAWRANLWLRTSIRVLLRVARFHARDDDELYRGAGEVAWERFLAPHGTLLVDARTRESALDHTHFIEHRVKDAVVDRFRTRTGERPSVDRADPDLRINTHLFRDRVTISVDTSGHSLHRRGWRVRQGRAPLAETTAAALVLASGWNRRAPLLDPFVGSGTIPIEAARIAAGAPPGGRRSFSFERWPGHDQRAFAALRADAVGRARLPNKLRLLGWDADGTRIEEARENLESAELTGRIVFESADARDFSPRPGWNAAIVTNPPYGERIGASDDLVALYRDFGSLLRERSVGSSLTLLSGNPTLSRALDFPAAERTPMINGGLECERIHVERIGPGSARSR
ncbi:MAG TPA: RNA methyltransferase [Planctomycetes bacterium]|nr:RNA methyltransferase [Planctomycetota bacterium]